MPINFPRRAFLFLGFLAFAGIGPLWVKAATIEVEEDDEEIAVSPTPELPPAKGKAVPTPTRVPTPAKDKKPPVPTATPVSVPRAPVAAVSPEAARENAMPRVRVGDNLSFYYLVRAGFVAKEKDKIPSVGKVIGSFDEQETYATPHKTYVEFVEKAPSVKKGDLLVISRAQQVITEPRTGFAGYWVENNAIVKVVEVEEKKFQVEIVQSFGTIEKGDIVRLYEDEVQRWKQAQTKKSLPDNAIQCFVAGGEPGNEITNESDWIVLTAGAKRGLVEGQEFQLRRHIEIGDQTVQNFVGKAQVFYVGPDYSMAKILFNHVPIEKGFEAVYQP